MNSEEGMSLAKMAVTVLLVVLVIGAVVALVYTAYSWFNSGSDKLGDQVNSIDASSYSQYDDAQVSGTDVLTALKTYRDSDIAIFICNATNGGYDPAGTSVSTAFNYCGLATQSTDYSSADGTGKTVNSLAINGEGLWAGVTISWNANTGLANRNTNFSPTTNKSLAACYVKQGGQFYSNLVYDDTTGEVCGILFRQMGN